MIRIVFFGSSYFSLPFLESLKGGVTLVVTTPDKIRGRGNKASANPVKQYAIANSIRVLECLKFTEKEESFIRSLAPDAFVVVSYGKMIPKKILEIVRCSINLHPSKLPLYRGASPIERQIIDGFVESAVTIMKISEVLDSGDIILQEPFKILTSDTKGDVEQKIYRIGVPLLKKALELIENENCKGNSQKGISNYAKKIYKTDEIINWEKDNYTIYNTIRALNPKPLAYTLLKGRILKIVSAVIDEREFGCSPGIVCSVEKSGFSVQCGKGSLKITEIIPEGKRKMSAQDFINGYRLKHGEKLGGKL